MTDHAANAADLDTAYHALARIGQRLGKLDPVSGTRDRALIDTLAGLQEVRAHLDREAVGAGLPSLHVRRDLEPATATRIAAAEAQRQQRAHELAAQVEREQLAAANGRRGWAGRQASEALRGRGSLQGGTPGAGDGDCPASLHNPAQESSGSAATARAQAAPNIADGHGHPETTDARCEPMARL